MTHALNLTLPIKQDAETQAKLKHLAEIHRSSRSSKPL
jgi:predicted transcriptional regulator